MKIAVSYREIYEIGREMAKILLEGKFDSREYTRYHIFQLRGCVYLRVSVYSANPNFRDVPAHFCVSETGEAEVHTPTCGTERFCHQNLAETLEIVRNQMIKLKADLKNF